MRNAKPICLLAAACLATALIAACKKDRNGGCATLYNATSVIAQPAVMLQLVDSQNRDLFNYNTPNHLDTVAIKQLNTGKLRFISKTYPGNPTGKNFLYMYYPAGEYTTVYSLSSTDQDTVYTNNLVTASGCSTTQKLIAFKYNGKSYTDTLSARSFVIVK